MQPSSAFMQSVYHCVPIPFLHIKVCRHVPWNATVCRTSYRQSGSGGSGAKSGWRAGLTKNDDGKKTSNKPPLLIFARGSLPQGYIRLPK